MNAVFPKPKRDKPFLALIKSVIYPDVSIRVLKRRNSLFQRHPMLATVQGILFRIPCIPHGLSIRLSRSPVNHK